MSTEEKSQMEKAGELLVDRAYVPTLLQELEKRGRAPQNEDQLSTVLQSIAILKSAQANGQGDGNIHKTANEALRASLLGENVAETEKSAQVDRTVDTLVGGVAEDDGVKQAAALLAGLQHAEA